MKKAKRGFRTGKFEPEHCMDFALEPIKEYARKVGISVTGLKKEQLCDAIFEHLRRSRPSTSLESKYQPTDEERIRHRLAEESKGTVERKEIVQAPMARISEQGIRDMVFGQKDILHQIKQYLPIKDIKALAPTSKTFSVNKFKT